MVLPNCKWFTELYKFFLQRIPYAKILGPPLLGKLTNLKVNVDPVENETLETLGNLPSLMYLWVTSKAANPRERLVVRSGKFICLKEFHFTCWSNRSGMIL
jgi:hypothetical protein